MFAGVISDAVIFDLDDTLIVEEAVARSSLRRAAELLEGRDPAQVVEIVLTTARRIWQAGRDYPLCHRLGIASWEGLWATFGGALRSSTRSAPGLPPTDRRPGVLRSPSSASTIRHSPPPCPTPLSRPSCRLAMLTNGPADIQRRKLDGTGLAASFRAVVISGEVGTGKQDPDIFALTLCEIGAKPESAVMVGDSWERDVLGALDTRLSAAWVSGSRPRRRSVHITVVASVGELLGRSFSALAPGRRRPASPTMPR